MAERGGLQGGIQGTGQGQGRIHGEGPRQGGIQGRIQGQGQEQGRVQGQRSPPEPLRSLSTGESGGSCCSSTGRTPIRIQRMGTSTPGSGTCSSSSSNASSSTSSSSSCSISRCEGVGRTERSRQGTEREDSSYPTEESRMA